MNHKLTKQKVKKASKKAPKKTSQKITLLKRNFDQKECEKINKNRDLKQALKLFFGMRKALLVLDKDQYI